MELDKLVDAWLQGKAPPPTSLPDLVSRMRVQAVQGERLRISEWLHAKADATEVLLQLAAERGEPELKAQQLWFAKKTRILLYVLATMIENDAAGFAAKAAQEQEANPHE